MHATHTCTRNTHARKRTQYTHTRTRDKRAHPRIHTYTYTYTHTHCRSPRTRRPLPTATLLGSMSPTASTAAPAAAPSRPAPTSARTATPSSLAWLGAPPAERPLWVVFMLCECARLACVRAYICVCVCMHAMATEPSKQKQRSSLFCACMCLAGLLELVSWSVLWLLLHVQACTSTVQQPHCMCLHFVRRCATASCSGCTTSVW